LFQVDRKQQAVILIIAAVLLFTAGYRVSRWQGESSSGGPGQAGAVLQNAGEGREILIHVSGAVQKPGVYKFTRESRVADALERAVPDGRADVQGLNLAAPLKDGQKIVVPLMPDTAQPAAQAVPPFDPAAAGKTPAGQGVASSLQPAQKQGTPAQPTGVVSSGRSGKVPRVNINRAGVQELESLPGLGPGLAGRIISYREANGLFASEEAIKDVPGIGEKIYGQIKDYIVVN